MGLRVLLFENIFASPAATGCGYFRTVTLRLILLVFLSSVSLAGAETFDPLAGRIGVGLMHDQPSGYALVDFVATGGPADLAGLKKGDLVTAIDSASTSTMFDVDALLHACDGGDRHACHPHRPPRWRR